jgi:hypothetical protein
LTTLDDLISPEDEDGVLSYLLTELANVGFPTTAWQTGSAVYTLLRVEARKIADVITLIAAIAKGGFLDLATGGWLTLLAKSHYQLDRYPPVNAVGGVRFTIASGSPAQTIQPGQLWVVTNGGKRYNSVNAAPVAIASGSSAVIPVRAEQAGQAYNVALATGLKLVTPLPGMTAAFEDTGAGTWLTTQGQDEEKDEPLRIRCRSRWATIGINKTRDAYVFLATNTPGLTTQPNRVLVDDQNPRGEGTVDVWIAGPAGPISTTDESAVRAYMLARKSPSTDLAVANALTAAITVTADVQYRGSFPLAVAQAQDNVTTYIQALPIGASVHLADVTEAIMTPDGMFNASNVRINGVAADHALAVNEVATVDAVTLTAVVVNDEAL